MRLTKMNKNNIIFILIVAIAVTLLIMLANCDDNKLYNTNSTKNINVSNSDSYQYNNEYLAKRNRDCVKYKWNKFLNNITNDND